MKHINEMCCLPVYRDHQIAGTWQHLVCEVTGSKSLQMWYINKNKMCFSSSSGHPPKAIRGDHESTPQYLLFLLLCSLGQRFPSLFLECAGATHPVWRVTAPNALITKETTIAFTLHVFSCSSLSLWYLSSIYSFFLMLMSLGLGKSSTTANWTMCYINVIIKHNFSR